MKAIHRNRLISKKVLVSITISVFVAVLCVLVPDIVIQGIQEHKYEKYLDAEMELALYNRGSKHYYWDGPSVMGRMNATGMVFGSSARELVSQVSTQPFIQIKTSAKGADMFIPPQGIETVGGFAVLGLFCWSMLYAFLARRNINLQNLFANSKRKTVVSAWKDCISIAFYIMLWYVYCLSLFYSVLLAVGYNVDLISPIYVIPDVFLSIYFGAIFGNVFGDIRRYLVSVPCLVFVVVFNFLILPALLKKAVVVSAHAIASTSYELKKDNLNDMYEMDEKLKERKKDLKTKLSILHPYNDEYVKEQVEWIVNRWIDTEVRLEMTGFWNRENKNLHLTVEQIELLDLASRINPITALLFDYQELGGGYYAQIEFYSGVLWLQKRLYGDYLNDLKCGYLKNPDLIGWSQKKNRYNLLRDAENLIFFEPHFSKYYAFGLIWNFICGYLVLMFSAFYIGKRRKNAENIFADRDIEKLPEDGNVEILASREKIPLVLGSVKVALMAKGTCAVIPHPKHVGFIRVSDLKNLAAEIGGTKPERKKRFWMRNLRELKCSSSSSRLSDLGPLKAQRVLLEIFADVADVLVLDRFVWNSEIQDPDLRDKDQLLAELARSLGAYQGKIIFVVDAWSELPAHVHSHVPGGDRWEPLIVGREGGKAILRKAD